MKFGGPKLLIKVRQVAGPLWKGTFQKVYGSYHDENYTYNSLKKNNAFVPPRNYVHNPEITKNLVLTDTRI